LKVGENGGYLRRCSRMVVSVGQMFVVRSTARWDSEPYRSGHLFGVCDGSPRVERANQPWAVLRNPVGILSGMGMNLGSEEIHNVFGKAMGCFTAHAISISSRNGF
jgi:hypothetical protein